MQLLESAMAQAQFELQLERVIAIKKKKSAVILKNVLIFALTPCGVPQLISDLVCPALHMSFQRLRGGFESWMVMWTPPVKSVMASAGVPAIMSE